MKKETKRQLHGVGQTYSKKKPLIIPDSQRWSDTSLIVVTDSILTIHTLLIESKEVDLIFLLK